MPLAMSLFPDIIQVDVNKLEPQYRNLKDRNGNPIQYVYANKGV